MTLICLIYMEKKKPHFSKQNAIGIDEEKILDMVSI